MASQAIRMDIGLGDAYPAGPLFLEYGNNIEKLMILLRASQNLQALLFDRVVITDSMLLNNHIYESLLMSDKYGDRALLSNEVLVPALRTEIDSIPHLCEYFQRENTRKDLKLPFGIGNPAYARLLQKLLNDSPGQQPRSDSSLTGAAYPNRLIAALSNDDILRGFGIRDRQYIDRLIKRIGRYVAEHGAHSFHPSEFIDFLDKDKRYRRVGRDLQSAVYILNFCEPLGLVPAIRTQAAYPEPLLSLADTQPLMARTVVDAYQEYQDGEIVKKEFSLFDPDFLGALPGDIIIAARRELDALRVRLWKSIYRKRDVSAALVGYLSELDPFVTTAFAERGSEASDLLSRIRKAKLYGSILPFGIPVSSSLLAYTIRTVFLVPAPWYVSIGIMMSIAVSASALSRRILQKMRRDVDSDKRKYYVRAEEKVRTIRAGWL